MDPRKLVRQYLSQGKVMQLATAVGGRPWICTVYYVVDGDMNIYWLSVPSRRHSMEIAKNNKVAITVPVKFDLPVVGVQAEGTAAMVRDGELVKEVMKKYTDKYGSGKAFYKNFAAGNNQHDMYKFTAQLFLLFDEVNFPDGKHREVRP